MSPYKINVGRGLITTTTTTTIVIILIIIDLFERKTLTVDALSSRSNYNEACNKTIKCQPTSWLSCLDGICQCAKPASMLYDSKRKKCAVKAGETCKYSFGDADTDSTDTVIPVIRYEYLDCVENANCQGIEGICKCISNHYEDGNGTCLPQKLAGSSCTNAPGECRSDLGLNCYKGTCDCDPDTTKSLYDNTIYFDLQTEPVPLDLEGDIASSTNRARTKFCAGLPGENCMQSKCVPDSSCYTKLNEHGEYNSTCICNRGLILSKTDKTCKGNYGSPCIGSLDCHEQFQCLNSHCTCKYNSHQVFDEVKNECRSIISAPCNVTEDCVVHSFCDNSNGFSSCQCNKGYVEYGPGFCRKGFLQPCGHLDQRPADPPNTPLNYPIYRKSYIVEESVIAYMPGMERQTFLTINGLSQSRVVIEDKCDVASRLECRNGKCDCEQEMEAYDEQMKACVGLVGALCRRSGGFSKSAAVICTENAECGSKNKLELMKPELVRCSCVKGYRATKDRRCTKS